MDPDYFLSGLYLNIHFLSLPAGAVTALLFAFLLLIVYGIASAAETAFFSLSADEKEELDGNETSADHMISDLLFRSDYLLSSLLILKNISSISVIVLCLFAFNYLIDFEGNICILYLCEILFLSIALLLFGENIPRMYAENNSLKFIRKIAPFLNFFNSFCMPVSGIMVKLSAWINKVFKKKTDLSVADLSKALELASEEIPEEKKMLEGIIKLYNTTAVEIMTSRLDISDMDVKSNFREVIKNVIDTGYSRIPVYSGNKDNITGILYIKDLLPYLDKPAGFRWQTLMRPAYFVPETKKIDDLLEEFKVNKIHIAVVVDEFGGTSGIVTLEDILEQIVGEIDDEYDEVDSKYEKLEDGSYIFEAKVLLMDFFRITGLEPKNFGKLTDDVDSLAGLILELKGDFPEDKEILEYNNFVFQILDVNKRRILKVKFIERNQNAETDAES